LYGAAEDGLIHHSYLRDVPEGGLRSEGGSQVEYGVLGIASPVAGTTVAAAGTEDAWGWQWGRRVCRPGGGRPETFAAVEVEFVAEVVWDTTDLEMVDLVDALSQGPNVTKRMVAVEASL